MLQNYDNRNNSETIRQPRYHHANVSAMPAQDSTYTYYIHIKLNGSWKLRIVAGSCEQLKIDEADNKLHLKLKLH